ncbi:MAG: Hsp70 family protein [Myxococcales bacterium]|nr:Hsp70 family protein [Myxococcales bacterium]
MSPVIGIDLGTTNSVVATLINNKIEVIPDSQGNRLHPSVVAFLPSGEVLVGYAARARRHVDSQNTVSSAKRLIGQSINVPTVRLAMSTMPYQCVGGANEQPMISIRGQQYSIPEISAIVLKHLRRCAERHLGQPVSQAVITVPANFTDAQRQATKYAGELAGLQVLRILNEPTAAALAYGFGRSLNASLAIYDLGGGTFDVTVLQIREQIFEVLATGGDSFLGGDDFDKVLLDKLAGDFLQEYRVDLRDDPTGWSRLGAAAEQIKCRLSEDESVAGTIHELATGIGGVPLALNFEVHRNEFDNLIFPYVERSVLACREVLHAAGVDARSLGELILVGGSTRTPMVRQAIEHYFGLEPKARINPDETVAYGAAIQAAALAGGGLDTGKFYALLLDVTPRALGIEVVGGFAETIIDKNTPVPVERVRSFSTSSDNQTQVNIKICQGEERHFDANEPLGVLSLHGLEPRPRGETTIEVTFTVDSDGILSVEARDIESGQVAHATIKVVGAPEADKQHAQLPEEQMPAPIPQQ